jgi:tRNA/tmRNA/rRNA uracil-C5-methylase (TrmA/RlmC/RlmD family)
MQDRVDVPTLEGLGIEPDVIVLDPPRAGAGREVMAALLAMRPRAIGYVGCDPAALARDVRVALDAGWELTELRAFDAFPMTHHVECVARLTPNPGHPSAGRTDA